MADAVVGRSTGSDDGISEERSSPTTVPPSSSSRGGQHTEEQEKQGQPTIVIGNLHVRNAVERALYLQKGSEKVQALREELQLIMDGSADGGKDVASHISRRIGDFQTICARLAHKQLQTQELLRQEYERKLSLIEDEFRIQRKPHEDALEALAHALSSSIVGRYMSILVHQVDLKDKALANSTSLPSLAGGGAIAAGMRIVVYVRDVTEAGDVVLETIMDRNGIPIDQALNSDFAMPCHTVLHERRGKLLSDSYVASLLRTSRARVPVITLRETTHGDATFDIVPRLPLVEYRVELDPDSREILAMFHLEDGPVQFSSFDQVETELPLMSQYSCAVQVWMRDNRVFHLHCHELVKHLQVEPVVVMNQEVAPPESVPYYRVLFDEQTGLVMSVLFEDEEVLFFQNELPSKETRVAFDGSTARILDYDTKAPGVEVPCDTRHVGRGSLTVSNDDSASRNVAVCMLVISK